MSHLDRELVSGVEAGDLVDRQLAVGVFEVFKIDAIAPASSQPLEADQGAQRCYPE